MEQSSATDRVAAATCFSAGRGEEAVADARVCGNLRSVLLLGNDELADSPSSSTLVILGVEHFRGKYKGWACLASQEVRWVAYVG